MRIIAAHGNCSVTCGATSYIISQWMMELQRETYGELKFDFRTEPTPKSPAAVATPEPEPGGSLISALAQGVNSQRARVSPLVATQICDCFSCPHVPQGNRRNGRLPPIILIGGATGRNNKYGSVQPIGSTSATGVSLRNKLSPNILIFKCSSTQAVYMSAQFNKVCKNPLHMMENIILTINRKGSTPFYKLYMHS